MAEANKLDETQVVVSVSVSDENRLESGDDRTCLFKAKPADELTDSGLSTVEEKAT